VSATRQALTVKNLETCGGVGVFVGVPLGTVGVGVGVAVGVLVGVGVGFVFGVLVGVGVGVAVGVLVDDGGVGVGVELADPNCAR